MCGGGGLLGGLLGGIAGVLLAPVTGGASLTYALGGAALGSSAGTAVDTYQAQQKQEARMGKARRQAKRSRSAFLKSQEAKRQTGQSTTAEIQKQLAAASAAPSQPMGSTTGSTGVQDVVLNLGKTKLGA